jgi:hypothetical protein
MQFLGKEICSALPHVPFFPGIFPPGKTVLQQLCIFYCTWYNRGFSYNSGVSFLLSLDYSLPQTFGREVASSGVFYDCNIASAITKKQLT